MGNRALEAPLPSSPVATAPPPASTCHPSPATPGKDPIIRNTGAPSPQHPPLPRQPWCMWTALSTPLQPASACKSAEDAPQESGDGRETDGFPLPSPLPPSPPFLPAVKTGSLNGLPEILLATAGTATLHGPRGKVHVGAPDPAPKVPTGLTESLY